MKKRMISTAGILFVLLLIFSSCGEQEKPPDITVSHNGKNIVWSVGLDKWNGADYERPDNFDYLFNYSLSEIPESANKNSFRIGFDGKAPDSFTLCYELLDDSGKMLGSTGSAMITAEYFSETIVFDFEDFFSQQYSSVPSDASYVGFRLSCMWGKNSCEYGFAIKLRVKETESQTETQQEEVDKRVNASIYRTDCLTDETPQQLSYEIIASYADLKTYYHENKAKYDFESDSGKFSDMISRYDDLFFKERLLFVIVASEKSDSFTLDLSSVQSRSGTFFITLERRGALRKANSALWHIVIEVSKNFYHGEEVSIAVIDSTEQNVNDNGTVSEDMYLISDTGAQQTGYENVMRFSTDGKVTVRLNNYNGFYTNEEEYELEGTEIRAGKPGDFSHFSLEYSADENCYIFRSESYYYGTMYDGTKLYITDSETYNAVADFHDEWNSNAFKDQ